MWDGVKWSGAIALMITNIYNNKCVTIATMFEQEEEGKEDGVERSGPLRC